MAAVLLENSESADQTGAILWLAHNLDCVPLFWLYIVYAYILKVIHCLSVKFSLISIWTIWGKVSKCQHNFSPHIWAQVSGTCLANSHREPTLYFSHFQTHFYDFHIFCCFSKSDRGAAHFQTHFNPELKWFPHFLFFPFLSKFDREAAAG